MIILTLFMTFLKILAGICISVLKVIIFIWIRNYRKALKKFLDKLEQGDTIEYLNEDNEFEEVTFIRFIDKKKTKLYIRDEKYITHIITIDKLKF